MRSGMKGENRDSRTSSHIWRARGPEFGDRRSVHVRIGCGSLLEFNQIHRMRRKFYSLSRPTGCSAAFREDRLRSAFRSWEGQGRCRRCGPRSGCSAHVTVSLACVTHKRTGYSYRFWWFSHLISGVRWRRNHPCDSSGLTGPRRRQTVKVHRHRLAAGVQPHIPVKGPHSYEHATANCPRAAPDELRRAMVLKPADSSISGRSFRTIFLA